MAQTTTGDEPRVSAVASGEAIERARLLVREIPGRRERDRLCRTPGACEPADRMRRHEFVTSVGPLGSWTRAGQALLLAGKARAVLHGRPAVSLDDVHAVAAPVLRHRLLVNFQAEAEGIDAEAIVARLLAAVRP